MNGTAHFAYFQQKPSEGSSEKVEKIKIPWIKNEGNGNGTAHLLNFHCI
jgi:hypothetical protein